MRFQIKGLTSLLMAMTFLILSVSGVVLYLAPRGRVANWTDWTMLGLEKQQWQAVHINMGLLFLVVTGLHLYLNWTIFWSYLKTKHRFSVNRKLETTAAFLLAGCVFLGAVLDVPPFASVRTFNQQIKDFWEREPADEPSSGINDGSGGNHASLADRSGERADMERGPSHTRQRQATGKGCAGRMGGS